METAIDVVNLRKCYGHSIAVDDLTFSVPRSSLFGFLGPNGSGKSTTVGCLTGVLDPTAGTIEVLGIPMTGSAVTAKRRIGVMPETLGLFEALYAHEFLSFQGRIFGLGQDEVRRRVTELLGALQLTEDAHKPLAEYSTGMRKRVAFAAAIIHKPDVLFLDEPFESVDPEGAMLMKDWLRTIAAQGRTVFLTSHVLETVERLCDRVAIIRSPGELVWQGDISPLAAEKPLIVEGRECRTLDQLYLQVAGTPSNRRNDLDWL